jgi:hypothetical protein
LTLFLQALENSRFQGGGKSILLDKISFINPLLAGLAMTQEKMTYAEALKAQPDGRSNEEIYKSIIQSMKNLYGGKITEPEAHEAARNLIGFCTEIVNFMDKKTHNKP